MPKADLEIRCARRAELPCLLEIERLAGVRFRTVESVGEVPEDLTPIAELEEAQRENRVWVAVCDDRLVGFAFAAEVDDFCHLEEVDVLPEYGRRGIGAALVREVQSHAVDQGLRGVTLTTYSEVPWNAPFYRRLGFEALARDALTPGLAAAVADEVRRGLLAEHRVVMRWSC